MHSQDLTQRLRVFTDAGLLSRVPTPWQISQGELVMLPYVVSPDATTEEGYLGATFGDPFVRQPLVFSQVGFDHLRTGSGLDVSHASLCAHMQLTYHRGMPVFDLQAVQTHPDGLERLQASITELLTQASVSSWVRWQIAKLIFGQPSEYLQRFLGDEGWIARARRFDYPEASAEGSAFPPEFFSLVGFLEYCATLPAQPNDLVWWRWPAHLWHQSTRRFHGGGTLGWCAKTALKS